MVGAAGAGIALSCEVGFRAGTVFCMGQQDDESGMSDE